jgi:hypothetical protein
LEGALEAQRTRRAAVPPAWKHEHEPPARPLEFNSVDHTATPGPTGMLAPGAPAAAGALDDELAVLAAVFGAALTVTRARDGALTLRLAGHAGGGATLAVPATYPAFAGGAPVAEAAGLARGAAAQLARDVAAAAAAARGEPCLFACVALLREAVDGSGGGATGNAGAEPPGGAGGAGADAAAAADECAHADAAAAPPPPPPPLPPPPRLTGIDAYIARLAAGETIAFRESGNSMVPRIASRALCTYVPVRAPDDARVGDAVFCKVAGSYYTHLVTAADGERRQISNNHGHTNGWTHLAHVFGRVVAIDGVPVRRR